MIKLNNDVMQQLKEQSDSNILERVELREKNEKEYNISVFTINIDNEDELATVWEEISQEIALYYQSEYLEKDIEIWNIYLFFLCPQKVSKDLKFKIENNKYSSRKIVVFFEGQNIDNLISNKLFDIKIENKATEQSKKNVLEIINEKNEKINELLEIENIGIRFDKLLEVIE